MNTDPDQMAMEPEAEPVITFSPSGVHCKSVGGAGREVESAGATATRAAATARWRTRSLEAHGSMHVRLTQTVFIEHLSFLLMHQWTSLVESAVDGLSRMSR